MTNGPVPAIMRPDLAAPPHQVMEPFHKGVIGHAQK